MPSHSHFCPACAGNQPWECYENCTPDTKQLCPHHESAIATAVLWFGATEMARRLGVSPATVRSWAKSGLIPSRRVGRLGSFRFNQEMLKDIG